MEMRAIILRTPPEQIALFKALIESYDNLATLRTEDPHTHRLRLTFAAESSEDIEALLDGLAELFSITRYE